MLMDMLMDMLMVLYRDDSRKRFLIAVVIFCIVFILYGAFADDIKIIMEDFGKAILFLSVYIVVIFILFVFGITLLGGIAHTIITIGSVLTILIISYISVEEIQKSISLGSKLVWLTLPLAFIASFSPLLKLKGYIKNENKPTSTIEKVKFSLPLILVVILLPIIFIASVSIQELNIGFSNFFFIFLLSTVVTAIILGGMFYLIHGGIALLLANIAILIHDYANGGGVNFLRLYEISGGMLEEIVDFKIYSIAIFIWSIISITYSLIYPTYEHYKGI